MNGSQVKHVTLHLSRSVPTLADQNPPAGPLPLRSVTGLGHRLCGSFSGHLRSAAPAGTPCTATGAHVRVAVKTAQRELRRGGGVSTKNRSDWLKRVVVCASQDCYVCKVLE